METLHSGLSPESYRNSGDISFEEILLCFPEYIDTSAGGLWWCKDAADVMAVKSNAVCLAGLGSWENVKLCKEWISKFKYIFVASPDRELVENVRRYVNWMVILSADPKQFKGFQNVAEYQEAHGGMAFERLMLNARAEASGGLINIADIKRRDMSQIYRTKSGLSILDKSIGGFRAGEMTVWTGKRGEGKSTMLGQMICEAIDQGSKVCVYSGELVKERFKDWTMIQACGPNHIELATDPLTGSQYSLVPAGVYSLIDEWWDRKLYLYDIGIATAHDEDSILSEFEYAARVLGCDVFMVDNIMTARLKGDRDYYRAQSLFTQRLVQFAKAFQVHVHLVAHPRKVDRGKAVDDSDDVSGTGDITNLADSVISMRRVEKDEDSEDNGHDAELMVLKSRETGVRGKIKLRFDRESSRFYQPDKTPNKRYGWELMRQETFTDCGEDTPFEEEGR